MKLWLLIIFTSVSLLALGLATSAQAAPPNAAVLQLMENYSRYHFAGFVLEAIAEQRLSATEWTFSEVKHFIAPLGESFPNNILVRWSERKPVTHSIITPKNAYLLKPGETFILLTGPDFYLREVYPMSAFPEYAAGKSESASHQFDLHVRNIRNIYDMSWTFFGFLSTKNWRYFERKPGIPDARLLTTRFLDEIEAQGGAEIYFENMGAPMQIADWQPKTAISIISMGIDAAEVRAVVSWHLSRLLTVEEKNSGTMLVPLADSKWRLRLTPTGTEPRKGYGRMWQIDSMIPEV
jgi:hypothetical protein